MDEQLLKLRPITCYRIFQFEYDIKFFKKIITLVNKSLKSDVLTNFFSRNCFHRILFCLQIIVTDFLLNRNTKITCECLILIAYAC